jgi:hypothetical protein
VSAMAVPIIRVKPQADVKTAMKEPYGRGSFGRGPQCFWHREFVEAARSVRVTAS